MELLDRIIGNGIYDVTAEQVLPVMRAFLSNENSRPKIFSVLIKRVKDHVNEFTLHELSELSLHLRSFGSAYEGVYQLIEPYIIDKLKSLSEDDLVNLI